MPPGAALPGKKGRPAILGPSAFAEPAPEDVMTFVPDRSRTGSRRGGVRVQPRGQAGPVPVVPPKSARRAQRQERGCGRRRGPRAASSRQSRRPGRPAGPAWRGAQASSGRRPDGGRTDDHDRCWRGVARQAPAGGRDHGDGAPCDPGPTRRTRRRRRHARPGEGEAGLPFANALRHDVGAGLRFRERQNGASAGRNDRRRELRRAVLSAARDVGAIATGDPFPD